MTAPISRFFEKRNGLAKKPKKFDEREEVADDGWQKPMGLTTEHPIELVDDSDTEADAGKEAAAEVCSVTPRNSKQTSPDSPDDCETPKDQLPGCIRSDDLDRKHYENNHSRSCPTGFTPPEECQDLLKKQGFEIEQQSFKISKNRSSVIDLCSPDKASSASPEQKVKSHATEKTSDTKPVNPFLKFAHDLGETESSYFTTLLTSNSEVKPAQSSQEDEKKSRVTKAKSKCSTGANSSATGKKRKRKFSKMGEDCEFSEKTEEQLGECRRKWHSFVDEDAPIEIRRFQVLIAARVHCQAQDPTVRKAMIGLRNFFRKSVVSPSTKVEENDEIKGVSTKSSNCHELYLSPETLSKADPEELSKIISSVLFANVKSKQIVQAAKEVKFQFHGKVPESRNCLKSITGIGPKLAELLFHVNSYSAHEKEALDTLDNQDSKK